MSSGDHVLLAGWLTLLLCFVGWHKLYGNEPSHKSPPPLCSVDIGRQKAFLDLRNLYRIKVVIEPSTGWRVATLTLYDAAGVDIRTSQVWDQTGGVPAARTSWVDWRDLPAFEPGDMAIVLRVTTAVLGLGCEARERFHVGPIDSDSLDLDSIS